MTCQKGYPAYGSPLLCSSLAVAPLPAPAPASAADVVFAGCRPVAVAVDELGTNGQGPVAIRCSWADV